jgi:hypothetical protein
LESYITLDQANQRGAPYYVLNRAIKSGIIDAIRVNDLIAIPERAMENLLDPELIGVPIRVMDAAKKYGVNHPTISRWADAEYIRTIEQRETLRILDEADVKRVATIYKDALNRTGSTRKAGWVVRKFFESK